MKHRIGIIGDGGWGTALALVLHRSGHDVHVWSAFPDYAEEVRRARENRKFLPGVPIPDAIGWTHDRREITAGADALVVAVPSRFYADTLRPFRDIMPANANILSVTKGLERETGRRMSEVAAEILGRGPVAVLSGPSHAEEVARNIPTAVVVASTKNHCAAFFQALFAIPTFRVYTSPDPLGVELGGALKNIIAIAAGVCDGLGFGDNTKAALITRGLAEMTRLGRAMGAQPHTFAGLSGLGDLVVTCMSRHSRNRSVGERLGRGEKLAQILSAMEQVAEGVWTCETALKLAQRHGVEMPLTQHVYEVLHKGMSPGEAVRALLARRQKDETL